MAIVGTAESPDHRMRISLMLGSQRSEREYVQAEENASLPVKFLLESAVSGL